MLCHLLGLQKTIRSLAAFSLLWLRGHSQACGHVTPSLFPPSHCLPSASWTHRPPPHTHTQLNEEPLKQYDVLSSLQKCLIKQLEKLTFPRRGLVTGSGIRTWCITQRKAVCVNCFLCCCNHTWQKAVWGKKAYFWLTARGSAVRHGWEGLAAGAPGECSHHIHSQEAERCRLTLTNISPFRAAWTSAHGMIPPTLRVALPSSVNFI